MSSYTSSLGLQFITPGSQAGLWGNTTNNTFTLVDQAVTGVTPISFASASGSTYTLTDYNGAVDEARSAVLNITGAATGSNTVVVPNKQKTYLVRNNTGQDVVFQTASPTATYTVGAGYSILIFCDGNNNVFTGIASPSVGTLSVAGGGTGSTTFGTGGFIKSSGGTSSLTASQYVALGSEVSGFLSVANGGTGVTSFTSGAVLLGNGTGGLGTVTASTNGYVLTWDSGTSSWKAAAPTTSGVTSLSAGTGIAVSGSTGAVTITNSGVTSLTAGSGITISGSTGGVTISASGGGGTVTSVSGGSNITITGTATTTPIVNVSGTIAAGNGGTGVNGSLTGISYMNGSSAHTVATAAQIVAAISTTAVANATNSTQLGGVAAASYATFSGNNTWTGTNTFQKITSINFNPSVGGVSASLLSLSGYGTDTASGAQILMSNPNAASGVRNKYLRVSQFGELEVLNTAYSFPIMQWQDNGNVNMNAGNFTLLNGDGYKLGGGTWGVYSDARLKDNVQPLTGSLDKIISLRPVTFGWKYETKEITTGFIAQEVQAVMPTAVSEVDPTDAQKALLPEGEKALTIGWKNDMTAYLVGAIQELKTELDAAKARIAELEAK